MYLHTCTVKCRAKWLRTTATGQVWQWLRIAAARPVSAAQLRTSAAWPLEQELRNTTTGPARQWMRISVNIFKL